MKEFVDRRFGERGGVFWFYACGPIFFLALLSYFLFLYIQAGAQAEERTLFLAGIAMLAIVFIVDSLAVYEARWVVHKAQLDGDVIRFTPLWGRMVEVPTDEIAEIRAAARSFGYIPAISLVDNNRPNIEVVFKNRPSIVLFGSAEADQWVDSFSRRDESD